MKAKFNDSGIKCVNDKILSSEKICKINGNYYIVKVGFSGKSADTVEKKIERLIFNEVLKKT